MHQPAAVHSISVTVLQVATILILQGLKIDVASAVDYTATTFGATGSRPKMITLDSAGNIYTVDNGSARVTKTTQAGNSSFFGATGAAPEDITIDSAGNIYTANWGSTTITKLSVPLAAPAFTLSSSTETRTVDTAASGFTINSTGGAIASFAINATPAGMSFNTTTGALTGTPNTVAAATDYTITATNASGNATRTFTLTVTAAPSSFNSLTLSGAATFRQVVTITANVSVASKVTFRAKNVIISGCKNKLTTGSSPNIIATCSWKPSMRGAVAITATAVPTGAGISSATATPVGVVVAKRVGVR